MITIKITGAQGSGKTQLAAEILDFLIKKGKLVCRFEEDDAEQSSVLPNTEILIIESNSAGVSLRDLQVTLPWTVHYHRDFRASPMSHKDFGHALLHVTKACGKIAAVVNDAEHGGSEFKPKEIDRFVADLVVCALRMANTCPGRTMDLQRAVVDRIQMKNDTEIAGVKQ